jgi:ElaA protein
LKQYIKRFDELTSAELYEILKLRNAVFIVEQNCAYQDIDGLDETAYHMWLEDENGIAAYVRLFPPGVRFEDSVIGRVIAVRRRSGVGSQIIRMAQSAVREVFGTDSVTIEAQVYAREFYEKLGFVQQSGEFDEDGIPHILMRWTANK